MNKGAERKLGSKNRQEELQKQGEAEQASAIYDEDPLKQYVRRYGWVDKAKAFQGNMQRLQADRRLKILTFPGRNATDVGLFLREGLVGVQDQIINVAICDKKNAAIVQANLANLGAFLAISDRDLSDTLEMDNNFIRQFPFDIINLDFCDQLFGLINDNNLKALETIFRLQRGQAFLLLLTSRCTPMNVDWQIQQAESIITNNMAIDTFRQAYIRKFGGDEFNLCMRNNNSLNHTIYPKMIAKIALDRGYEVNECFAAHYQRSNPRDGIYYMACHSFELFPLDRSNEVLCYAPNPKRTTSDLLDRLIYDPSNRVKRQSVLEYERFVTQIIERDAQDVDDILANNEPLRVALNHEAAGLRNWWENN